MLNKTILSLIVGLVISVQAQAVCGQAGANGTYTCCETYSLKTQCCSFDSEGEALKCRELDPKPPTGTDQESGCPGNHNAPDHGCGYFHHG